VNDRLTVEHFEKLILLFNRFEGINGTRDCRAGDIALAVLQNLTPDFIDRLANQHGLEPSGPRPWKKTFTAGSDDHSGIYVASAYTRTPQAVDADEYLAHLRNGLHDMGGTAGTSLRLAHSFYQIAYSYYKSRFLEGASGRGNLLGELFQKLLDPRTVSEQTGAGFGSKVRSFAGWFVGLPTDDTMSDVERVLVEEFSVLFGGRDLQLGPVSGRAPESAEDARVFHLACGISQQVGCAFVEQFVASLRQGKLIESLQTLSSLGPVALAIAPYLAAFRTQHKDERFLQAVATRFEAAGHLRQRTAKKAWFTDTFADINGVARTIQALAREAVDAERELMIVTCQSEPPQEPRVTNFAPGSTFALPGYESQKLGIPPFLEVLEYLERERFSEVIISTPGPLGLAALAAGRLLGLRVTGIYHSDFPVFIRHLTGDATLEKLTWKYMQWFFGQLDTVFVPSKCYERDLVERGFAPERLQLLRRGVDLKLFHHQRRRGDFWRRYGCTGDLKFLYVGRLSAEKNLDPMFQAFVELQHEGLQAELVVVGDGPQATALRERYRHPAIYFIGVLEGDELADAYAAADIFLFPSTSDTFGNAVLEAQACGLPAIVSDRGGPIEIIVPGQTGLAVDVAKPGAFRQAMQRLAQDEPLRRSMSERAVDAARGASWRDVLEQLWGCEDGAPAGVDLLRIAQQAEAATASVELEFA
jgi:glycosyltransferase involved in cell wall biosynthesis